MRCEVVCALSLAVAGCVPELDVDESWVTAPRVVAVRAAPAEVAPGERVTLDALALDTAGIVESPALEWSLCVGRFGADAPDDTLPAPCARGEALVPIGTGPSVEAEIPREACQLFGPDLPPPVPGEPPGRPTSSDSTGGYAIPVVVRGLDAQVVFGLRLRCGVAGATQEQAASIRRRYTANEAPEPTVERVTDAGATPLGEEGLVLGAGARARLRVRWPACPTSDACGDAVCGPDEEAAGCPDDCASPRGCGGAERYLRFDPVDGTLVVDQESMRVAWLSNAEGFELERNGALPGGDDFVENEWTAPAESGDGWIAVVVRDSRGAAAWRYLPVTVTE